jgi:hypothetical protein
MHLNQKKNLAAFGEQYSKEKKKAKRTIEICKCTTKLCNQAFFFLANGIKKVFL